MTAHTRSADRERAGALSPDQTREWAVAAARAAADKGGQDTLLLDVSDILAITDAFVITSGLNTRQVRTMAEEVEARVKEAGGAAPLRIEGLNDARWVLLDFGDFVVHIFLDEARRYYQLERLWADSARIAW
ncbi:MAG: ribosome silencing factor [Acidimicrobiales bacterium]|nr:MAG: ribosome silencing factor [Acidimicrobiales bacterium]